MAGTSIADAAWAALNPGAHVRCQRSPCESIARQCSRICIGSSAQGRQHLAVGRLSRDPGACARAHPVLVDLVRGVLEEASRPIHRKHARVDGGGIRGVVDELVRACLPGDRARGLVRAPPAGKRVRLVLVALARGVLGEGRRSIHGKRSRVKRTAFVMLLMSLPKPVLGDRARGLARAPPASMRARPVLVGLARVVHEEARRTSAGSNPEMKKTAFVVLLMSCPSLSSWRSGA